MFALKRDPSTTGSSTEGKGSARRSEESSGGARTEVKDILLFEDHPGYLGDPGGKD